MTNYILGLDLGPTSIGWALVETDAERESGLVDAGVRVFPEGVDRDTKGLEQSKNATRRTARGARRQKERRRQRKRRLRAILRSAGLWPKEKDALASLWATDPYQLRVKALDYPLTPYELGRVLYHLNQRRGFKSNRKSGKNKEDGKVFSAITELEKKIHQAGCRTLGEYFFKIRACERIRNHYTHRNMYQQEFAKIWDAQKAHHPAILTDGLKSQLADEVIFFQRPLKPQADKIGACELEPDEKRCPKADWYAQQFRMLQDINNLRIIQPHGEMEALTNEQRSKLVSVLGSRKEMTFDEIRECLDLMETQVFNYEGGKRTKIKGNLVEAALSKAFGKRWPEAQTNRDRYNEVLLDVEDPDEFHRIAREEWDLNDKQIAGLAKAELPEGYLHISRKAIRKLLPFMEAGDIYSSAIEKAGYLRNDQKDAAKLDKLPAPPDIRNPIVQKALYEVRKVVNAIIREYGKPAGVRIEMARDMKGSVEDRDKAHWEMLNREREREAIRQTLRTEFDIPNPTRNDIERYRLWVEQDHLCPYTGETIPQHLLFTSDVQVDHILPYSRSLDDSLMNKTLCYTSANREKGDRTPYEWLGEQFPERYDKMLQTIRHFTGERAWRKRQKFSQKEIDLDTCIERQLNDTRYISREVRKYLGHLGIPVGCTKGQVTAELRHQWGLDAILDHAGGYTKNRDDHRHHAVDAVVIALTTPRHLQRLAKTKGNVREPLPEPWDRFRDTVAQRINTINVSHRVTRKVSGALHEETAYGPTGDANQFVCRKSLEALKGPMIEKIVDPTIREIVRKRLIDKGWNPEKPGEIPKDAFSTPLTMPSGVPIRRVRIKETFTNMIPIATMKTRTGKPYRFVSPGRNHHVEIVEDITTGLREGIVVSMFETVRRVRRGEPIIRREHGPGRRFVMSLCKNEMFNLQVNGQYVLCRIQKFDVNGSIILRPHTYAGKVSDTDKPPIILRKSASTLQGEKVTIDPLGRMRLAND